MSRQLRVVTVQAGIKGLEIKLAQKGAYAQADGVDRAQRQSPHRWAQSAAIRSVAKQRIGWRNFASLICERLEFLLSESLTIESWHQLDSDACTSSQTRACTKCASAWPIWRQSLCFLKLIFNNSARFYTRHGCAVAGRWFLPVAPWRCLRGRG